MRISELKGSKTPFRFGTVELYLRFDMDAIAALDFENVDFFSADINAKNARKYFFCGLARCRYEMNIPEEKTEEIFRALGVKKAIKLIAAAMLDALPRPVIGAKPTGQKKTPDILRLRCLFCDIIGKPDGLFWHSTLREILDRWEAYAVAKGFKETETVKEFDDE